MPTIAADAGAGPRTVRRALARLAELRLLSWVRRLVRTADWRTEQISSAYALCLPEGRPRCDGQTGRRILQEESSLPAKGTREGGAGALTELLRAAVGLPDLAAIRAARERVLGLG